MIIIIEKLGDFDEGIVSFIARGKLVEDDYLQVVIPEIKKAIHEHDKIDVLIKLEDFEGWTPKAAKEDFKLISKIEHFEKMAIVGKEELDKKLTEMLEYLAGLLPDVAVRFFKSQDFDSALNWLKE